MSELFEFALLSFTSMFTMINPLGIIPVYGSLTADLDDKESKAVAIRAVIVAMIILFVFAVTGKFIFDLFWY